MFINLIKTLCAVYGISKNGLGEKLGYKTPSAFQRVVSGNDIRLSVLLNICNLLGYNLIITNGAGVNIDVTQYYAQQQKQSNAEQ